MPAILSKRSPGASSADACQVRTTECYVILLQTANLEAPIDLTCSLLRAWSSWERSWAALASRRLSSSIIFCRLALCPDHLASLACLALHQAQSA